MEEKHTPDNKDSEGFHIQTLWRQSGGFSHCTENGKKSRLVITCLLSLLIFMSPLNVPELIPLELNSLILSQVRSPSYIKW